MAFETRKVYRAVSGAEFCELMIRRMKEALALDSTMNLMRSFPLFSYKVSIELTPYRAQGTISGKVADPLPGQPEHWEIDGVCFVPVEEAHVELVERSQIYGHEADPNALRTMSNMPTTEKAKTEIGEVVDVPVPPPAKPKPEPEFVPTAPQVPAMPGEQVDETIRVEAERWGRAHQDAKADAAIKDMDPSKAAGRVSVVKSTMEGGGSDHGFRRKP